MDDPTGPATGSSHVIRGGSWNLIAGFCRSALRFRGRPGYRFFDLGLRVSLVSADKWGVRSRSAARSVGEGRAEAGRVRAE